MAKEKRETPAAHRERLLRRESVRLRTARIVNRWHRSVFHRASLAFRETVMMTDLRTFSLLLAPAGLTSLFRALFLPLLNSDFPFLVPDGIAGGLLTFFALLLFAYPMPFYRALTEDTLLSRLFFNSLALPRPYASDRRGIPVWVGLPAGLALATLALLTSPLLAATVIATACVAVLTIVSPEFSLILLAITFPLASLLSKPTLPLSVLLLLTLLSYLLKLLRGKRRFTFALTDFGVLLLSLFLILSFAFSKDPPVRSAEGIAAAILFAGGYLLAANLPSTRRTLLHFTRGLLIGGSLLGIAGVFCGAVEIVGVEDVSATVASIFKTMQTVMGDGAGFSAALLLLFPLLPAILSEADSAHWRLLPMMLLFIGALALTLSPVVYLALLLALVLFVPLALGKPVFLAFLLFAFLPNALFLLPESTLDALSSISFLGFGEFLENCLASQSAALLLLSQNPFGIGSGAAGAANLYLQLACTAGIPSLLLFLLILFLSTVNCKAHTEACTREPYLRFLTTGIRCGIFSVLIFGVLHAPLTDLRFLIVLSLVLGLLRAVRRTINESEESLRYAYPAERETAATEVRLSRRRER